MGNLSSGITAAQVSLSNLPERTVWVDDTVCSVSNNNGGNLQHASFRVYRDNNNVYKLDYSIEITSATGSPSHVLTLGLGGVTFSHRDAGSQGTDGGGGRVFTDPGTVEINYETGSGATIRATGVAQLSGKPSWFDANREAGFSVAAQIDEATATNLGLVKKPKTQEKVLGGDVITHGATFLQFNNLIPGRRYRYIASCRCFAGTALNSDLMGIHLKNGSNTLVDNFAEANITSDGYRWTETFNKTFTCAVGQTTAYLSTNMAAGTFTIQSLAGSGTTYAELIDITDTEEVTTDFT